MDQGSGELREEGVGEANLEVCPRPVSFSADENLGAFSCDLTPHRQRLDSGNRTGLVAANALVPAETFA